MLIGIDLALVNGGVVLCSNSSSGFRLIEKLPWISKSMLKALKDDTGKSVTADENLPFLVELHQQEVLRPIMGAVHLLGEEVAFILDWTPREVHMRGNKILSAKKAMLAGYYTAKLMKFGPIIYVGPGVLRQSLKSLTDNPGNLSKEEVWKLYIEAREDPTIEEIELWNELSEHERDATVLCWAYWRKPWI